MENVERAIRSKAFAAAMEVFKNAGYATTTVTLAVTQGAACFRPMNQARQSVE